MAEPLKVLFVSAEVEPFAKRGGLGDVAGSLPKALRRLGHDVRVVMPAYRNIEVALHSGQFGLQVAPGQLMVPVRRHREAAGVLQSVLPGSDVPVYFIAERSLFDRGEVYGYWDDPYRFAFFSRAALELTQALGWRPDLLHAHDWHSAPAVTWLATAGQADDWFRGLPSVFTIHNLAHQGTCSWDVFDYLDVVSHGLVEETFGEVNFMARGIYHATMVNTVSPTYAQEIMTREGGAGLEGLLRYRSFDVHGILNGLDTEVWDPATDPNLAANFDLDSLERRAANKRALQARAGLPQRDDVPLVALISRLDWQKGLDISGHVLHNLMNAYAGEAQFVGLGSGAPEYESMLAHLATYHQEKMAVFLDYMPDLAPLIYGGSDVFLMPSRFEPCGLGQMIAMRYGNLPVVRATGGLADTVEHGQTGFTFQAYSADALWQTLAEAVHLYYNDRQRWRTMQENGMRSDFSWERSARSYEQLYRWAVSRMRGY
jgi:starch synthase